MEAQIGKEKDTGRNRGFGFVHYAHRDHAAKALKATDGDWVNNKRLRVTLSSKSGAAGGGQGPHSQQEG